MTDVSDDLRAAIVDAEAREADIDPDDPCEPCDAAMLARVQEASSTSAPKLTLCVNTYNEGPDVLQTILSFRAAYDGPFEAVVVADGTTDGSCDDFSAMGCVRKWTAPKPGDAQKPDDWGDDDGPPCPVCGGATETICRSCDRDPTKCANCDCDGYDDCSMPYCDACGWVWHRDYWAGNNTSVVVIHRRSRVGCGKAKAAAVDAATGDVLIFADGHCRVLRGELNIMARICAREDWILAPGVAPLHCQPDEQPALDHRIKSCSFGGFIHVSANGAKVEPKWRPKDLLARRTTTWWAIFMMSKRVATERLGGWNEYPGRWGSQEIGLALRAWFADVPIYAFRDTVCGHRYRNWNGGPNFAYYGTRRSETRANHRYCHAVVFDPETVARVWEPAWQRTCPSKGAEAALVTSACGAQGARFREACKRRTDEEFFAAFCPHGAPVAPVSPDDITAIILNYKRPRSAQRCMDAIRRAGIHAVWVWCQENARPPRGATRVFRDSENASTWARYCVAPLVPTPWILFCDDDVELTPAGVAALCAGAAQHPGHCLGLIGARFEPPFTSYRRRTFFKAHKITQAEPVDMLWPKGQLIPRDMAQAVFGRADLWQRMRAAVGSTSGDDLVACVAQEALDMPYSLVVPSDGKPYREGKDECPGAALSAQPGRSAKKKATMATWRELGWTPYLESSDV